eukprot:1161662-Pelagomonas_calceolata.AAC.13
MNVNVRAVWGLRACMCTPSAPLPDAAHWHMAQIRFIPSVTSTYICFSASQICFLDHLRQWCKSAALPRIRPLTSVSLPCKFAFWTTSASGANPLLRLAYVRLHLFLCLAANSLSGLHPPVAQTRFFASLASADADVCLLRFFAPQVRFLDYIRQWRKKVVFVINKADMLTSPQEVEQRVLSEGGTGAPRSAGHDLPFLSPVGDAFLAVCSFVSDNAARVLKLDHPPVIAVSSRSAMRAKEAAMKSDPSGAEGCHDCDT